MINANKKRLRRTMMFLNAQKPGLIKDPYIYKPDSIMLDLEDAVAETRRMQHVFLISCIKRDQLQRLRESSPHQWP